MGFLTPKERVMTAIRHQKVDRLPRGELLVEEPFLDRLHPEMANASYFEKMKYFAGEVGLDLVTIKIDYEKFDEGLKEIRRWTNETNYFVIALVDGLFWKQGDPLSFKEFLIGIKRKEERVRDLINWKKGRALQLIKICINGGTHGFIIGDDLAYNRGPFLERGDLQKWIFPGHREIVEVVRERHGIAFLHSCGNLTGILDIILSAHFDGIHGLAPSAGNDPLAIRKATHKRLTLMGIFEVDHINPLQIENMKERILPLLDTEGGYIFGSSEGLSVNTPIDSFRALYMNGEGQ